MTRKECLDMAAQCVLQDRASEYGGVEDNFRIIANFWSIYLGRKVYPADVAMMMALLKVARIRGNKAHADSFVDLAGYAACGAECASGTPSPALKDGDELVMLWKHKPEGKFAVKSHVDEFFKADPKFKPGDKVEALSFDGSRWEDAVVERTEFASGQWHCTVRLASGERHCLPVAGSIRRPPKAEGCEELVAEPSEVERVFGTLKKPPFSEDRMRESMPGIVPQDAPATPEDVCRHIVESNPAVYGHPHKPTGEELAEMAREDGDGN